MRRGVILPGGGLGGLALAALAAAGVAVGPGVDIMADASPRRRARPVRRRSYSGFVPAGINRHTGKPHEHRRAIARATTAPGTPERAAAVVAARVPSK